MKYKSYKGWYKIINTQKFIKPLDEYMESTVFKDGNLFIQYKSKLEYIAFRFADLNPKIVKFSVEPFNIKYIKPLDNKEHRYYIDLFLEFQTGEKFLVEVKSKAETHPPKKPKSFNARTANNYKTALETYIVNTAKWKAVKNFAESNNMNFLILTEDELK